MSTQSKISAYLGVSIHIFGFIFLARLIRDMGARVMYPFIPQLSEGLGLTVIAFSWLIFLYALAGLTGPIFGILTDRYGRRKIMVLALLCQGIGALWLAFSQQWESVFPMFVMGLGVAIFIPAQQAYISDQTSYEKRGRALGTVEYSWALTAILILPVAGWLIENYSWRTPFLLMAPMAFLGAAMVWFGLPRTERHTPTGFSWSRVRSVILRSNVIGAVIAALFIYIALGSFLSLLSIWLSNDFGLGAAQLGLVAMIVGITELGGSVSSSLFIDRIGKKRGGSLGLLLGALVFLMLPLVRSQLLLAVGGLVLLGLMLEFTIVSLIPLYSEQAPEARGTVLSLTALGGGVGVAIGPPLTANLWEISGLWAICIVTTICLLVALGIISRLLHEV
jgi:predicted MFS family arabinose efflux permease